MEDESIPVWTFDKVEITQIEPILKDHNKLHNRCYVTIDFGFFIVHDIGISYDTKFGLAWSQDFGWSRFKFMDSYIENPYGDEVRKLEAMVKIELECKKDIIIDFLKGPLTFPELLSIGDKYETSTPR